jgi:putative aldouronate transport system permease protein
MGVSGIRVLMGGLLNVLLIVLTAYPLSKSKEKFRYRTPFVWFFFVSSLFNGGLIPGYVLIRRLNLLDTIGALIFPTAVPVFSVVLMLNFFRQVPEEMDEAAQIDGASKLRTLFSIYLPVSLPSLATVALFSIVYHWNSYFDGLIFSNRPQSYPLQTYLRTILVSGNLASMAGNDWKLLQDLSDRTVKAAQIIIAIIPILCIYPFMQRYFVKGMTLGSVKG